MNVGKLVLGSTSMHECGSTGTGWEYWYSGVLVRTNAGVLVLGWEYWYSLPISDLRLIISFILGRLTSLRFLRKFPPLTSRE